MKYLAQHPHFVLHTLEDQPCDRCSHRIRHKLPMAFDQGCWRNAQGEQTAPCVECASSGLECATGTCISDEDDAAESQSTKEEHKDLHHLLGCLVIKEGTHDKQEGGPPTHAKHHPAQQGVSAVQGRKRKRDNKSFHDWLQQGERMQDVEAALALVHLRLAHKEKQKELSIAPGPGKIARPRKKMPARKSACSPIIPRIGQDDHESQGSENRAQVSVPRPGKKRTARRSTGFPIIPRIAHEEHESERSKRQKL